MNSRSSLVLFTLGAVAAIVIGCGGGKRRAEHARGAKASAVDTQAAPASQRCQVNGFAYTVPGPGNIAPASAVIATPVAAPATTPIAALPPSTPPGTPTAPPTGTPTAPPPAGTPSFPPPSAGVP